MTESNDLLYLCDGHACDSKCSEEDRGCIKFPNGFCLRTSDENHALHNHPSFPETYYEDRLDYGTLIERISEFREEPDDSKDDTIVRDWQLKLDSQD